MLRVCARPMVQVTCVCIFHGHVVPMGSLMHLATVVQALGYSDKLDLVFDGKPLDYLLFMKKLLPETRLFGEPAVQFDLLIRSCAGQAKKSIAWMVYPRKLLYTNDKTKVCD